MPPVRPIKQSENATAELITDIPSEPIATAAALEAIEGIDPELYAAGIALRDKLAAAQITSGVEPVGEIVDTYVSDLAEAGRVARDHQANRFVSADRRRNLTQARLPGLCRDTNAGRMVAAAIRCDGDASLHGAVLALIDAADRREREVLAAVAVVRSAMKRGFPASADALLTLRTFEHPDGRAVLAEYNAAVATWEVRKPIDVRK